MTTSLADLVRRFEDRRSAYLARVGQAQALQDNITRLSAQVAELESLKATYELVGALFQSYSEAEHEELRERIETLVTFGIQSVFGEDLSFRVTPGVKSGQATLEFSVVSTVAGDEIETDVMEARGGGVAAIIGFILRVVILALGPDSQRRFLLLDETFGMVSEDYQEPLSALLRRLVDDTGLQVLLVTHAPKVGLDADQVYRFSHDGDRTVASALDPSDL